MIQVEYQINIILLVADLKYGMMQIFQQIIYLSTVLIFYQRSLWWFKKVFYTFYSRFILLFLLAIALLRQTFTATFLYTFDFFAFVKAFLDLIDR